MICPNCQTNNSDSYKFCMKCGQPLNAPAPEASQPPVFVPAAPLDVDTPPVQVEAPPSAPFVASQAEPVQPAAPVYAPPVSYTPTQQPIIQNPVAAPPPQSQTYRPAAGYPESRPYGQSQINPLGIWRPFAGYGTRRRHVGWLMDNQGGKAVELSGKVTTLYRDRAIPGAQVENKNLVGRGLVVESRPYFLLQRGLVTVGLYIAQFGKDLFVSIASYLKPPISGARVALLGVMTLFAFYTLFLFPGALNRAFSNLLGGFNLFGGGGGGGGGNLGSLICVVGPLGTVNLIALGLFVVYSIYKYVTEKDILAGLRVEPNEFNEDDLMALEKAVEQTVRISLDELGLNPDDLKPLVIDDGRRLI